MEKCELDDLSDSDDELWLICFVLLNDVICIHVFCIVFSMDPLRTEIKLYYCYYYFFIIIALLRHSKWTHDTCLAISTPNITSVTPTTQ